MVLRRSGKSYLMYQRIHQLLQKGHITEEFLYINFEDGRLIGLSVMELNELKSCYEELYHYAPIFFLDEIQIIEGWEKFVRRLTDTGYQVYVTGSNAKMLSSEIATTLGGRFLIQEVYPYSFQEYLKASGITLKDNWLYLPAARSELVRAFDSFFHFGGLLELVQFEDKWTWLGSLYQKIFFGDLIPRYGIRNSNALRMLIKKRYGEHCYYYNQNVEIDFYIPDEYLAIQVSYNIDNDETLKREVNALQKAVGYLQIKEMYSYP